MLDFKVENSSEIERTKEIKRVVGGEGRWAEKKREREREYVVLVKKKQFCDIDGQYSPRLPTLPNFNTTKSSKVH